MMGVFCQLAGALAPVQIVLSSAGTPDCRQAMDNLPTVFLSIWSSAEYFVLALSPEYAGQLWIFSSLPAALRVAPKTSTATPSHQSLFFMAAIIERDDWSFDNSIISVTLTLRVLDSLRAKR